MKKHFELNNSTKIPSIGFGTWLIEDGAPCYNAVKTALNAGYTHIDTAATYKNEASVGKAIKEVAKREDIFLTTKVWNTDRGYNQTLEAFNHSLKLLQTDYVDLYLIHWPANQSQFDNWAEINSDTWRALETLYEQCKAKAIGVSNFLTPHLEALWKDAKVKPMVNQIEFHPGYTQEETVKWCKDHNVLVQAWSPLGSGRILEDPQVIEIANKYNISVGQVCILFALQQDVLPLPKSTNPERIALNLEVGDVQLTKQEIELLKNIQTTGFSGLNPSEVEF